MDMANAITTLTAEIADCIAEARRNGYDGTDRDYQLTALDCDSITNTLGYKPTREEWADAGYRFIGDKHVAAAE
jgi:hypothetical protein